MDKLHGNSWPNTTYEGASSPWSEKRPGTIATNSIFLLHPPLDCLLLLFETYCLTSMNAFFARVCDLLNCLLFRMTQPILITCAFLLTFTIVIMMFLEVFEVFQAQFFSLHFLAICNTNYTDSPNINRIRLGNALTTECGAKYT